MAEDETEYRVVIAVYRDGEKIVQVGARHKGPQKFVEAFPVIYQKMDEQIMKVLEHGEIIDTDPPMQDEGDN